MIVHQTYALIDGEIVKNIIVCDNYEMANVLARASYGNGAIAIDCLQYPCMINDKYKNGIFYHIDGQGNEVQVPYVPTAEQSVIALSNDIETMTEYTVELDARLCTMELGI